MNVDTLTVADLDPRVVPRACLRCGNRTLARLEIRVARELDKPALFCRDQDVCAEQQRLRRRLAA